MLNTFARPSHAQPLSLVLTRLVLVLVVGLILALLAGIVWVCVLAAIVGGQ